MVNVKKNYGSDGGKILIIHSIQIKSLFCIKSSLSDHQHHFFDGDIDNFTDVVKIIHMSPTASSNPTNARSLTMHLFRKMGVIVHVTFNKH